MWLGELWSCRWRWCPPSVAPNVWSSEGMTSGTTPSWWRGGRTSARTNASSSFLASWTFYWVTTLPAHAEACGSAPIKSFPYPEGSELFWPPISLLLLLLFSIFNHERGLSLWFPFCGREINKDCSQTEITHSWINRGKKTFIYSLTMSLLFLPVIATTPWHWPPPYCYCIRYNRNFMCSQNWSYWVDGEYVYSERLPDQHNDCGGTATNTEVQYWRYTLITFCWTLSNVLLLNNREICFKIKVFKPQHQYCPPLTWSAAVRGFHLLYFTLSQQQSNENNQCDLC